MDLTLDEINDERGPAMKNFLNLPSSSICKAGEGLCLLEVSFAQVAWCFLVWATLGFAATSFSRRPLETPFKTHFDPG
jgi:hypothetical protein